MNAPLPKKTIEYICKKFNFSKNIKQHKVILTTAKCTSTLGKRPKNDKIHKVCGNLDKHNINFTSKDYLWALVCKYFFECHTNQKIIDPQNALNLIIIEINQFIKARKTNPMSIFFKELLQNLK